MCILKMLKKKEKEKHLFFNKHYPDYIYEKKSTNYNKNLKTLKRIIYYTQNKRNKKKILTQFD